MGRKPETKDVTVSLSIPQKVVVAWTLVRVAYWGRRWGKRETYGNLRGLTRAMRVLNRHEVLAYKEQIWLAHARTRLDLMWAGRQVDALGYTDVTGTMPWYPVPCQFCGFEYPNVEHPTGCPNCKGGEYD